MQTQTNNPELYSPFSEILQQKPITNTYFVIVADKFGVFAAFATLKSLLANDENAFLTFIYAIQDANFVPLFQLEPAILEKRFAGHFMVFYFFR